MDSCPQGVADLKDGVSAGVPMTAGGLKRAGVDEQNAAMVVADRVMGMAIDDTVNVFKLIDELIFEIVGVACPVD